MSTKETLSLVAILVCGLIVFLIVRDKSVDLRLTRVENTLGDIWDNSNTTKLALGCMLHEQQALESYPTEEVEPVGFKYNQQD